MGHDDRAHRAPVDLADIPPRCLPVWQLPELEGVAPAPWGRVSAEAGRAAAACVVWAARAALRGEVAALVTAPLHKEALAAAGVHHPGPTELLQAESALHAGVSLQQMPVRMMLANDELRTVLVSIHVALRDAITAVTQDSVLQTLRITHAALSRSLGGALPAHRAWVVGQAEGEAFAEPVLPPAVTKVWWPLAEQGTGMGKGEGLQ